MTTAAPVPFASVKNPLKRQKMVRLLATVVAGTQSPVQCAYLNEKDAKELHAADATLIEIHPTQKDKDGNHAVRATAAGVAINAVAQLDNKSTAAASPVASSFQIRSDIPVAPSRRSGVGSTYPFDKLEVGQSFHIPASEARPNPAKSLNSTVASATRRYKDQTPARKFVIRAVGETDVDGVGARVWRTV